MAQNNVLVLGAPHSGKLRASAIIGADFSDEDDFSGSHSGLIFKIKRQTKYFKHDLSIMVDEYPEKRTRTPSWEHLNAWSDEFMSEDMEELRRALDGIVFCLNVGDKATMNDLDPTIEVLEKIYELLGGAEWAGFFAIVGVSSSEDTENHAIVEDAATIRGFEYINLEEDGQNEFRDKLGRDRLVELFDTHDWSDIDTSEDDGFAARKRKMAESMCQRLLDDDEKNMSVENGVNDVNVEEFENVIEKLKQARIKAESMEGAERNEYAQQVMEDVLLYL